MLSKFLSYIPFIGTALSEVVKYVQGEIKEIDLKRKAAIVTQILPNSTKHDLFMEYIILRACLS